MAGLLGRVADEHTKMFLKSWFGLVSGSIISGILQILGLIVLTGCYSPGAFGEYALILSIAFILSPVATGRIELGIVTSSPGDEFRILVSTSIARSVSFFFALQICIEIVIRAHFQSEFVRDAIAWRLLPLLIVLFSLINILIQISIRNQSFKVIAQRQILQNFATVMFQLSASRLNSEVTALILGEVGGRVVSILTFFWMFNISANRTSLNFTFKDFVSKSWHYRKAMLASLVDTGSTYIFIIMPVVIFDPILGGVTAMGFRIANLPIALVGATLGQIFLSFASPSRNWGTGDAKNVPTSQLRNLLYVALVTALATSIGIAVITILPWADEWKSMMILIPFLFMYTLTSMVWNPCSTLIITFRSWDKHLHISAQRFALLLATTLISYFILENSYVVIGIMVFTNSLVDILGILRLKSLVFKSKYQS